MDKDTENYTKILKKHLEHLSNDRLNTFIMKFCELPVPTKYKPIPVEDLNGKSAAEIAEKIIRSYTIKSGPTIVKKALKEINENQILDNLEKDIKAMKRSAAPRNRQQTSLQDPVDQQQSTDNMDQSEEDEGSSSETASRPISPIVPVTSSFSASPGPAPTIDNNSLSPAPSAPPTSYSTPAHSVPPTPYSTLDPSVSPAPSAPSAPQQSCQNQPVTHVPVKSETRGQIDALVLAISQITLNEGEEQVMLRGLSPTLRRIPEERRQRCLSLVGNIMDMYTRPEEPNELARMIDNFCWSNPLLATQP